MSPPISDEECIQFAESYIRALSGLSGVFRVTNIAAPDGKPKKWPFQMLENRDSSHLQDLAVASIDVLDALVVDGASCVPGQDGERTSSFRTVAVFAESARRHRLISIRRRDEGGDGDATSLSSEALAEFRRLLEPRQVGASKMPVISLEPELSDPDDRRKLVLEGGSYAIKVEANQLFSHPTWDPDDPLDAFDPSTTEALFATYRSSADPTKATYVPIRDLQDRRAGASGAFEEYLFRFPPSDQPEYFIARVPHSPSARPAELLRGAGELALRAHACAQAPPGTTLRLTEFQSPRIDRYYQAVRIVDRGLYCQPNLGKERGSA
ncbi:MAG TPA: hypothetical protein VHI77_03560 [Solirubrobacterales bacterium]|jgi:hypothetical protein|nr:hypothetical protein [Solirubrobacterales bacterium]